MVDPNLIQYCGLPENAGANVDISLWISYVIFLQPNCCSKGEGEASKALPVTILADVQDYCERLYRCCTCLVIIEIQKMPCAAILNKAWHTELSAETDN